MATLNTLKDIIDGIFEFSYETYEAVPKVAPQIFDVQSSSKAYETGMDFVLDAATEIVGEGEANRESKIIEGYTWGIANRKIRSKAKITKEAIDDGKFDIEELGRKLGEDMALFEERWAHRIFNYGALTAGNEIFDYSIGGVVTDPNPLYIYDGGPFFDTAHPVTGSSDTYSNHSPSLALTAANLETALTAMEVTNAYDNAGNEILIKADTLFVPSSLVFTARRILESQLIPGYATNDINVLNSRLNIVESRWLTDADGWFIGSAKKGIRLYERQPLTIETEWDATHQVRWIYLSKRVGVGVTNWRYWYGANISAT